jgi:D-glycero-D-manno-heptose 1,7-bisphosphate phosphatase
MEKLLFIDRDGVINIDKIGDYIKTWEEFKFEPGSLEALKELTDLGYQIIIISNQAGVGDKEYSELALWDIHKKMLEEFEKHDIRIHSAQYCLHGKNDGCECRKPKIGLFKKAVQNIAYDPNQTYFIGDKVSDVEAGKRFGIKTVFVRTGHGKKDEPKLIGNLKPDYIFDNLKSAVKVFR